METDSANYPVLQSLREWREKSLICGGKLFVKASLCLYCGGREAKRVLCTRWLRITNFGKLRLLLLGVYIHVLDFKVRGGFSQPPTSRKWTYIYVDTQKEVPSRSVLVLYFFVFFFVTVSSTSSYDNDLHQHHNDRRRHHYHRQHC